jgi:hypothetical protein
MTKDDYKQLYEQVCEQYDVLAKELEAIKQALAAPVQPVAQAWDEGYRAGIDDERTSEANIGIAGFDAKVEPARNNPYRTTPPAAQPAPVQSLPFGVGGGLVAIKTLLSRDPCVHANTAIEMIDAILKEHPAAQRQWVGLTDEEIEKLRESFATRYAIEAIEAKLKEKNNG